MPSFKEEAKREAGRGVSGNEEELIIVMPESRREVTEELAIGELLKMEDFQKYYNSPDIDKINLFVGL